MRKLATLISTSPYASQITALLTFEEQAGLEYHLSSDPSAHPVIPGAGGVRKVRWGRTGMGKRGGIRVIYFWMISAEIIVLLAAYPKNAKENLSNADKKAIREAVEHLQHHYTLAARSGHH